MINKRLSEINVGKKAVIIDFEKDDIVIKLMEMGCLPGEIVTIEKKLPGGILSLLQYPDIFLAYD